MKNTGNVQPEETYFLKNDAIPGNAREYFKGFAKNEAEVDAMLEHLARLYQNSGKIDESNQIYNDLITANPGDFKVVGYQYEIMLNTETQGDPIALFDSVQSTVGIFVKARDEHYKGATPEAVKNENDKLQQYVLYTAKRYHKTAQKDQHPLYLSLTFEIYKTYLDTFPDEPDNFKVMYYSSDIAYFYNYYEEAARGFEHVIELYDKGLVDKSDENTDIFKDSVHGALHAYDKLMSSDNTNKEACPDIPVTPEAKEGEEQTYPEFPIPECRLNFIKAAQRYVKNDPSSENAQNVKYKTAVIYYDYNHFNEARHLFQEIIQDSPKSEAAVYSANYLIEMYRLTKQYSEMRVLLSALKGDSEFMANNTEIMRELIVYMNNYEEALDYKLCEDKESEKQWEEAARCYEEFAVNHKDSEAAEIPRSKASAARKQSAK